MAKGLTMVSPENESLVESLAAEAMRISRRMDIWACNNTDDCGNWVTRKAENEYRRMARVLEKLDAQLSHLGLN